MKKTFKTNKIEEWVNLAAYYPYLLDKILVRLLYLFSYWVVLLFKGPGHKETLDKRTPKSEKDFFDLIYMRRSVLGAITLCSHIFFLSGIWNIVHFRSFGKFYYFAALLALLIWLLLVCLSEKKSWYYLQKFQKMSRMEKVIKGIIVLLYVIFSFWLFFYTLKYHF